MSCGSRLCLDWFKISDNVKRPDGNRVLPRNQALNGSRLFSEPLPFAIFAIRDTDVPRCHLRTQLPTHVIHAQRDSRVSCSIARANGQLAHDEMETISVRAHCLDEAQRNRIIGVKLGHCVRAAGRACRPKRQRSRQISSAGRRSHLASC